MVNYINIYTKNKIGIKMKMETTIGLMAREMKSFLSTFFMQYCGLFLVANIAACIVVIKTYYTKFVQIESIMTMSTRVQKWSLVMTISTHLCVWRRKSEKPLFVCELHFSTQQLQLYLETYHGLQCVHSHTNNVTNEYPNH